MKYSTYTAAAVTATVAEKLNLKWNFQQQFSVVVVVVVEYRKWVIKEKKHKNKTVETLGSGKNWDEAVLN